MKVFGWFDLHRDRFRCLSQYVGSSHVVAIENGEVHLTLGHAGRWFETFDDAKRAAIDEMVQAMRECDVVSSCVSQWTRESCETEGIRTVV